MSNVGTRLITFFFFHEILVTFLNFFGQYEIMLGQRLLKLGGDVPLS